MNSPIKSLPLRMADAWSTFWFQPSDPTRIGLMRLLAGAVTLYTFIIHGVTMQTFLANDAWVNVGLRKELINDRGVIVGPLSTSPLYDAESPPPPAATDAQVGFINDYRNKFGLNPPGPHPINKDESDFAIRFRAKYGFDFRYYGLPFPKTKQQIEDKRNEIDQVEYLDWYAQSYRQPFPPPYPTTEAEKTELKRYFDRHEIEPRRLYARGIPIFSVWLHVLDPMWMSVVQGGVVFAALCFFLGLGTRVSSAIVWFGNLCYVHRDTAMLFGVDTMMTVLLLYLMIGPSGAALSLDRLIARWWSKAKPRYFPKSAPANYSPAPQPLMSATMALRMMQIHLCLIYFISGISKLQGMSWWNGTAVWNVLCNFEFAPMHLPIYNEALRWICTNELVFNTCINGAGFMTLAFEIAYPFLVWRPKTRWLMLIGAIFLHGFIGLLMGLKTFSLMMLIFNMAFLRPEEVAWLLSWIPAARPTPSAAVNVRRKPEAA